MGHGFEAYNYPIACTYLKRLYHINVFEKMVNCFVLDHFAEYIPVSSSTDV